MQDLRSLFGNLPSGDTVVNATVQGTAHGLGTFLAPLTLTVNTGSLDGSPSLAPNPMNPRGVLTFTTARPGHVTARIYDLRGRVVRTVVRGWLSAGHQYLTLDGRGDRGEQLSSGVYMYRIELPDRNVTGKFTIMK